MDPAAQPFLLMLLTGKALDWATVVWNSDTQMKESNYHFTQLLAKVFEYPVGGHNVSVQFLRLRQSCQTSEYDVTFRTLTGQSGWNNASLKAIFPDGLIHSLKTELVC